MLRDYKRKKGINKTIMFKLVSEYKPTGDQPEAIEYLSKRNRRR